jgi:hypothetical protein
LEVLEVDRTCHLFSGLPKLVLHPSTNRTNIVQVTQRLLTILLTLEQITPDIAHQALAPPSLLDASAFLLLTLPSLPVSPDTSQIHSDPLCTFPSLPYPSCTFRNLPIASETFLQLRGPSYPFRTLHICTGSPPGPSLNIFVCMHDTVVGPQLTSHSCFVIL